MSNIDFLIQDVIKLLSNTKITFSQGGAADLQKRDGANSLADPVIA